MKKKNKFKRVKEHGYIIIVDGHTTFPKDICRMLDRLDFLEKERIKKHKCLNNLSIEIYKNNPLQAYSREEVINICKKHLGK